MVQTVEVNFSDREWDRVIAALGRQGIDPVTPAAVASWVRQGLRGVCQQYEANVDFDNMKANEAARQATDTWGEPPRRE